MEVFIDILLDALIDSLKMLPFLFGAYLLIEYLEHHSSERMERALASSNKFGPVTGALLGCVPQCGFSVAAANLYSGRVITLGTLLSVFLSTSDEALPVLLASPGNLATILTLLAVKTCIGIFAGLLIDFFLRRRGSKADFYHGNTQIGKLCEHCHCEDRGVFRSALSHTLNIFLFIFVFSLILGGVVELIGQERFYSFLMSGNILQPLVTSLFGFIPNCAASVFITDLYLQGALSFGAAVAGLSSSAGVGLLVLFRINKNMKENFFIVGLIYLISAGAGMVIQLF